MTSLEINSTIMEHIPTGVHHKAKPPSLLQLPAELRNKIYEYALTEREGLVFQPIASRSSSWTMALKRKTSWRLKHLQPFNSLCLVNRQLRKETKDLELKYNTIYFVHLKVVMIQAPFEESLYRGTATTQFSSFLRQRLNHTWLQSIVLINSANPMRMSDAAKDTKINLPIIAGFCKTNPQMNVKYILHSFDSARQTGSRYLLPEISRRETSPAEQFVFHGVTHTLALRNVDLLSLHYPNHHREEYKAYEHGIRGSKDGNLCDAYKASNLRFYPLDTKLPKGVKELSPLSRQLVKDWIKNGI